MSFSSGSGGCCCYRVCRCALAHIRARSYGGWKRGWKRKRNREKRGKKRTSEGRRLLCFVVLFGLSLSLSLSLSLCPSPSLFSSLRGPDVFRRPRATLFSRPFFPLAHPCRFSDASFCFSFLIGSGRFCRTEIFVKRFFYPKEKGFISAI